jgi:uncharacterized membrane protein YfhO
VLLYSENSSVLEAVRRKTEEYPVEIEFLRDDHLRISADAPTDESVLIVSIPADKEWRVTVDGAETDAETDFGIFLAVPMMKGSHVINLQYSPRELGIGLVVSCLTIMGIAAYAALDRNISKKSVHIGKNG